MDLQLLNSKKVVSFLLQDFIFEMFQKRKVNLIAHLTLKLGLNFDTYM